MLSKHSLDAWQMLDKYVSESVDSLLAFNTKVRIVCYILLCSQIFAVNIVDIFLCSEMYFFNIILIVI